MKQSGNFLLATVAGATGAAGKEIVRALAERGVRVRALVRNPAGLGAARKHCAEVRVAQVTEADSLRGALDGSDLLVSAVGKTRQKDRTPRRAVDVGANLNLFAEARRAGVGRIAFISVAWADPHHPVEMMRMKGEVEEALKETGLEWVIIRPSGYFSDMWEAFETAKNGTLWTIGDPRVRFNPISLEDLGEYVAEAVLDDRNVGRTLTVGGPESLDSYGSAEVFGRVRGRPVKLRRIPLWAAKAAVAAIKPFNRNRNLWEMAQFFVGNIEFAMKRGNDATVPAYGRRGLEEYLRDRLSSGS